MQVLYITNQYRYFNTVSEDVSIIIFIINIIIFSYALISASVLFFPLQLLLGGRK